MKKISIFFLIILSLNSLQLLAQTMPAQIALNQVGFYPNGTKMGIVINGADAANFFILSVDKKDTVYRGKLTANIQSLYSSAITKAANFTTFTKSGKYVLFVPSVGYSSPFIINKNILYDVAKASVKAFYFQRASMPLENKYAGIWARKEGHPDSVVYIHPSAISENRPENTVISSSRGWYDAGDYNKYIVNSGITMGTMMSAYEDFPTYFNTLKTNIPESNNGIPDLLNEVLYNLRWMLTMQDLDGGVYHKCTNANFDAMIMPEAAVAKRFVVQKGTAASLDFAAVTAQACRIFKRYSVQLPGLADSCLAASKLAWKWAVKNPEIVYDQNEMNKQFLPKIVTGDYGDKNFKDEFFWAASELLATTKDTTYLAQIQNRDINIITLPSWNNVDMLGCFTLLRFRKQLPQAAQQPIQNISKKLIGMADNMISNGGNKAFSTIFGQSKNDFIWGSSSVAMNQSILLINTYLLTKNKKYFIPAVSNMDYVLGRNATGYCFVTGFGSKSTMHPHHRPSVADNITEPVPGLLSGGPNPGMQDKCFYANKETETAYSDADCSYASNEIAINWNAPLVYVTNAIEVLQLKF